MSDCDCGKLRCKWCDETAYYVKRSIISAWAFLIKRK